MKIINKKNIYMLFLFVVCLLTIVIIPTYAKFGSGYITDDDMVEFALAFDVDITNIEEYEELIVSAGESFKFNVQITNGSNDLIYYGIWYRLSNFSGSSKDIEIGRMLGTETTTSGSVESDKVINVPVVIVNNSDKPVTIDIGVASSIISTNDIEYLSGKYLITGDIKLREDYEYFMDVYDNDSIYLIRNDGATSFVNIDSTEISWYTEESQSMSVCAVDGDSSKGYIWCIGDDNNTYYKVSYMDDKWNMIDTSYYIDVASYSYSIFVNGDDAYIVRSDGKINFVNPSGLEDNLWNYGSLTNMAVCSGYYNLSKFIGCVGQNGYFYYNTSYDTTDVYFGGVEFNLVDRTVKNSWIDINLDNPDNVFVNIMESDNGNIYNTRITYQANDNNAFNWYKSSIPGGGIKICASTSSDYGYSKTDDSELAATDYNYCLSEDNYLYYKTYDSIEWIQSSLKIK